MKHRKKLFFFAVAFLFIKGEKSVAQNPLDSILPVRGLAIAAPPPSFVDSFVQFIDKELAPRQVNTLVLRVDFNYQYTSHPELRDSIALSKNDVQKLSGFVVLIRSGLFRRSTSLDTSPGRPGHTTY